MGTASKVRLNAKLLVALAAVLIVGVGLSIGLLIVTEIVAGLVVFFIAFVAFILLVVLAANNLRLEALRRDLRRFEKTLNNTAGSAGKSAPLIRDIHQNLGLAQAGDLSVFAGEQAPSETAMPENVAKLTTALEDREKLESQALRQIVAEARLIRMYIERAESIHD